MVPTALFAEVIVQTSTYHRHTCQIYKGNQQKGIWAVTQIQSMKIEQILLWVTCSNVSLVQRGLGGSVSLI